MGTLRTHKRKFGAVSSFPDDFSKNELDPIANEKVLPLAYYMYYSIENITLEATAEIDRLGLSELYGRALKASQDVSIYRVSWVLSFFFFFFTIIHSLFLYQLSHHTVYR